MLDNLAGAISKKKVLNKMFEDSSVAHIKIYKNV